MLRGLWALLWELGVIDLLLVSTVAHIALTDLSFAPLSLSISSHLSFLSAYPGIPAQGGFLSRFQYTARSSNKPQISFVICFLQQFESLPGVSP